MTRGQPLLGRVKGALAWRIHTRVLASAQNLELWRDEEVPVAPASASDDQLRQLVQGAITALNDVDIDGCVRPAMMVATAPCPDDNFARLQIKESACYILAVALLQGLGRLDEAILWWRERNRVAAVLARHFLEGRDPARIAERIFDTFWSSHLGHTAVLGIYVKRNLLRKSPRTLTLVRPPAKNSGNPYLVEHWRRYFTLVDSAADLPFPPDALPFLYKNMFLEDRLEGPESHYWRAYAEISRAWEEAGGGALLDLSPEERLRGGAGLVAMGIPEGAWYVCLHVRAAGFKSTHEGLQDALNADIGTYASAIDAILQRGGWVVRMGDPSMPRLPSRHGVVDYAHNPQKSDWMDIFLFASCRCMVGTSSGPAYVPSLFGVPGVFTNWFPNGTRPLNSADLFIPKLHWYEAHNDYVPFDESLAPPLGHIHSRPTLRALGVSLRDNEADDLRDVVVEMLDRLEEQTARSPEDAELQARFDAVAENSRSFGNARIGRNFIRKYRRLLPSGTAGQRRAVRQSSTVRQS